MQFILVLFVLIAQAFAYLVQNADEFGEYFQGDIFVSGRKNALVGDNYYWPNAEIPIEVIGNFAESELQSLCRSITAYHKHTCIRFRPRIKSDMDYLQFDNKAKGCWSALGRSGGAQIINFQSKFCFRTPGTAMHELMHAIGFAHEHSRDERDDFIQILWDNIRKGHEANFEKTKQPNTNLGLGYDLNSILHYSARSFAKNKQGTIKPKLKGTFHLGQRKGFSCMDVQRINKLYNCTGYLNHPSKSNYLMLNGHC